MNKRSVTQSSEIGCELKIYNSAQCAVSVDGHPVTTQISVAERCPENCDGPIEQKTDDMFPKTIITCPISDETAILGRLATLFR